MHSRNVRWKRARPLARVAWELACALLCCTLPRPATAQNVSVHYQLHYAPEQVQSPLRVVIDANGLSASGAAPRLVLADRGAWLELDGYLSALRAEPPLAAREGTRNEWEVVRPAPWDGRLHVEYELQVQALGSETQSSYPERLYRAPDYVLGFSANTLLQLQLAPGEAQPQRALSLQLPEGWVGVTGIGVPETSGVLLRIPDFVENTLLSFGRPRSRVQCMADVTSIDVIQWGGETDSAADLCRYVRQLLELCTQRIGTAPRNALRLVATEGGAANLPSAGAIVMGLPQWAAGALPADSALFLAHEILRDWVASIARGGGSKIAWFEQGFTAYCALIVLVSAGLVPPEYFVEELLAHAQALAELGMPAELMLADSAGWNGPAQAARAMHSGALLAFALDVELYNRGRPGAFALLRSMLALPSSRFGLQSLHTWCKQNGLDAFYQTHISAPLTLDLRALLTQSGWTVPDTDDAKGGFECDTSRWHAFLAPR